jgi:SAM-dependent methyltransferase
MLKSTAEKLCCPARIQGKPCQGQFRLEGQGTRDEVVYGALECERCGERYPILEGVAIVVPEPGEYLLAHVKGISKFVPDSQIPSEYRDEFTEQREALEAEAGEHIEEDLESGRVNALYLMNHYLGCEGNPETWWKSVPASESPEITEWIRRYWDRGPFETVSAWIEPGQTVLELGCGVGGLCRRIRGKAKSYLGVDSSFHSILLARHLNLGAPYRGELRFPGDLLFGNLAREFTLPIERGGIHADGVPYSDFVVGEIDALPLPSGKFEVAVSMNAIDMLNEPKILPEEQFRLVSPGGVAIQTGPYIWHDRIAKGLRGRMPKGISDSAAVVEWLYRICGFRVEKSEPHVPWLFFKHLRQIELYSVHALYAKKPD